LASAFLGSELPRVRGIIADLDGVVYRGNTPIDSAVESFASWRQASIPYCFVTNNSTRSPEEVAAKLTAMGVLCAADQVITSATGTTEILKKTWPKGGRAFALGAPSLIRAVEAAEFEISHDDVDCVVAGLDRELTYERLSRAVQFVLGGATLIGTNPDVLLPTDSGFEPGAGSLLAAIVSSTRVNPIVVGKPQPHLINDAVARLGIAHAECLMIGDQLDTDIVAAQNAGIYSVMVETGVPNSVDSTIIPDLVVPTLLKLRELLSCERALR
jgi:4-nitrophenyl phosphatase